jgi:putative ABC transport system substrate-binding protein
VDLSQKSVELLHEIVPSASRFAVIGTPVVEIRHELEAAATHVGTIVSFNKVTGPDDFDPTLAQAKKDGAGGIIVSLDALTYLHRSKLVRAALRHRLPGIYWSRDFAEVGGLMSYGANVPELGRHAALYVDKILKGAKPADLPVEEPTKFELIINLKTAKALGLMIPQSILVRADEIIQ